MALTCSASMRFVLLRDLMYTPLRAHPERASRSWNQPNVCFTRSSATRLGGFIFTRATELLHWKCRTSAAVNAAAAVERKFTASLLIHPPLSNVAPSRLSKNRPTIAAARTTSVVVVERFMTAIDTSAIMPAATHPAAVPDRLIAPFVPGD